MGDKSIINEIDNITYKWWKSQTDTTPTTPSEEMLNALKSFAHQCQRKPEGEYFTYNGQLCYRKFDSK